MTLLGRARFNIEYKGKTYGVLVTQKRYSYLYKIAKSPFKKETATLREEFVLGVLKNPKTRRRFFKGGVIEV